MRFFLSARFSASVASFMLFHGTYYAWTPTGGLSFCTRIGKPSKRLPLLTKRIGPISVTPIGSTGSTAITVCCRNGMRRKEEEEAAFQVAFLTKRVSMLGTLLLVVLIVLLLGALPSWPYSRGWGYYPSGLFGLVLLVVVVLLLMGYL